MLEITIQGQGFAKIDQLASRLQNLEQPLAEVGAYLERKAKLRFVTESDPSGKKWAPLRPSTLRYKKTNAILRETGAMAASIAFNVSRNAVTVKPSVDYAIFHQTGAARMAARPIMGFEAGDPEAIAGIISGYLGG
jgi:phage virion morphogenesis protein